MVLDGVRVRSTVAGRIVAPVNGRSVVISTDVLPLPCLGRSLVVCVPLIVGMGVPGAFVVALLAGCAVLVTGPSFPTLDVVVTVDVAGGFVVLLLEGRVVLVPKEELPPPPP